MMHENDFKVNDWVEVKEASHPLFGSVGQVFKSSDGYFQVRFEGRDNMEWLNWKQLTKSVDPDRFEDIGIENRWPVEKEDKKFFQE